MTRREKKAWRRRESRRILDVRRMNDRHDRWHLHAFMRALVEVLAREDVGVDQKLAWLAAAARRTAPAIMSRRAESRP